MSRRRSRRHRRLRLIRRGLVLVILILAVCSCAYLLDSVNGVLWRSIDSPKDSVETSFGPPPSEEAHQQVRRIYPYSVVPGGVADAQELRMAAANDKVVGQHYSGFDIANARVVRLKTAQAMYVSYRLNGQVYWTGHRVLLLAGEPVITDGSGYARTRCGNRLSQVPRAPTSPREPPPESFDIPTQVVMARWPSPLTPPDPIFVPEAPPPDIPPQVTTKRHPVVPFFPPILLPPGHNVTPITPRPPAMVPEPSTLALFAGGLAALWAMKRGRKRP